MQPPPSTKLSKIYRWRPKNRHVATLIEVELSTNLNSQLKLKTTTEEEIIRNIFNLYSVFKKSHFIFLNYTKEFPRKETSVFMGIFSRQRAWNSLQISAKSSQNSKERIWRKNLSNLGQSNMTSKPQWENKVELIASDKSWLKWWSEMKLALVKIWRFNTKCFQGETDLSLHFTICSWKCWFMGSRESRQIDQASLDLGKAYDAAWPTIKVNQLGPDQSLCWIQA